MAKNIKILFPTSPFELIHTNVWGPSLYVSIEGHRLYIHFLNDYSRFTWVFSLKTKSNVLSIFIKFPKLTKN